MFVSQTKYTRDLLEHIKMMECTHINTLIALKSTITPSDEQPIDLTQYRQLVGSLQYLTFTRLEIVHVVNKTYQHFQAPTKAESRAVKRILRYLSWSTILFGKKLQVGFWLLVFFHRPYNTSRKNASYDAWFLGASKKCQGIGSILALIEYF